MIFCIAEDEYYYTPKGQKELKRLYDIDEIVLMPDVEEIKKSIRNTKDNVAFLSPMSPSLLSPMFSRNLFFEIIHLKNKFGLLTTGQKKLGISEKTILEQKMGIKFHEPKETFNDYAGAEILREALILMEEKEKHGLVTKGFMLTGIPGTGKSFFAKCAAGETNRKLIELNLSIFMEMENGIQALSDFFDFFKDNVGRYIIWIDEIEKMLKGEKAQRILGVLLTKINDLNGSDSESSFFFIATANNISDLASSNPEFFRNGRFDFLVFIASPTQENAVKIFDLYISKKRKSFEKDTVFRIFLNVIKKEKERESTLAEKIYDIFDNFLSTSDIEVQNLSSVADVKALSQENIKIQEVIERVVSEFVFSFDVERFILIAMRQYAGQVVVPERYVHTPAEIEFIVSDSYSSFLFSKKEIDYGSLVSKYQPLEVTMKESISKMSGVADRFIKI